MFLKKQQQKSLVDSQSQNNTFLYCKMLKHAQSSGYSLENQHALDL